MSNRLLRPDEALSVAVAAGANLEELIESASEIVIFGSWTTGAQTPNSDVDVLCVGRGRRHKCESLDIVWISERHVETNPWLGSELASHIAAFGVWIHGRSCWADRAYCSAAAAARKADAIRRRAAALNDRWSHLAPPFRKLHATLIRRDVQRFRLLREAQPVPPTRLLDEAWQQTHSPLAIFREWTNVKELRHAKWEWLRFRAAVSVTCRNRSAL